jgi:REP element-mobilizing transposase RayT
MNCLLIGWVLMPEHFHLLLKPQPAQTTPLIVKELKEETAKRILKTLRENLRYPWCRKILARLRLPSTVHDESHFRLWQRRFHPFNVYSEEKRREKLNYMHNNPVKRGLVSSPGDWPWSRRGGEVLLLGGRIRPPYGPAGLSCPIERVPLGDRRPQKAGSAPAHTSSRHYGSFGRRRGLCCEEWPWSSFRFYYLNDSSLLSVDSLVELEFSVVHKTQG